MKLRKLWSMGVVLAVASLFIGTLGVPAQANANRNLNVVPNGRVAIFGSCNGSVHYTVVFGARQTHGTARGILVKSVGIGNYSGSIALLSGNFHNMGGYGGQGHRDLGNISMSKDAPVYTWNVNTVFWFAGSGSQSIFSSQFVSSTYGCQGWNDITIWHG